MSDTKKPLVSVIMPVYNVEKYIECAVSSITDTDFDDYEIILTDDGSKDSSGEICDRLAEKNPKIRVIHQQNGGVSKARNSALEISQGKYIYFMDPDDYAVGNLLSENLEIAEKYSCDQVIFGFVNEVCNEKGTPVSHTEFFHNMNGLYSFDEFKKNYITHLKNVSNVVWNRIYSKKSIGNVLFDTTIHTAEDAIFNLDLLSQKPENIYYNNKLYYVYLRREKSLMNDYNPDRFKNENLITGKMEELSRLWNMEKDFEKYLATRYISSMLNEYNNMLMPDCPLSAAQAARKIKEYTREDFIIHSRQIVKPSDISQPSARLCYILVNMKLYKTAYYFRKLYTPLSLFVHKIHPKKKAKKYIQKNRSCNE